MTTKKQRGGGRSTSKQRATRAKRQTKRAPAKASTTKSKRAAARRSTAKTQKAGRTPRARLEKLIGRALDTVIKTGRSVKESGATALEVARRRVGRGS